MRAGPIDPGSGPVRRSRPGAIALGAAVAAVAVILGVLLWERTVTGPHGDHCDLDQKLVQPCGVLLGVTPTAPSMSSLRGLERDIGRPVDLVYSFHDLNDTIPSAFDRSVVRRGQVLHVDIDVRDYASPDRSGYTWSSVAAGTWDDYLTRQARGIASLNEPVFVTFDHEPDQPSRALAGGPADYVAAWRHVHDLFVHNGATNAVWVWVVTGWPQAFPQTTSFWPGNSYVDWIGWESYDGAGCVSGSAPTAADHQTFARTTLAYFRWIHAHGPGAGIDVDKPMMISEAGAVSIPGMPAAAARWYAGIVPVLREHPQIKALTLWDHSASVPTCDFRFDTRPDALASIRSTVRNGWLDPFGRS